MTDKKTSQVDQAEVYWGNGEPDAKFSPETWAYFYADTLLAIARHAEREYSSDLTFRRLLKELNNI